MTRMSYREAKVKYGDRLRIAALGAIAQGPPGDGNQDWRIIHDGTHGVMVNTDIRVPDHERPPLAADVITAMDRELEDGIAGDFFSLVFDASKAHRRIPILESDWGLLACQLDEHVSPDNEDRELWLNTVGTYGIGSASWWWARLAAFLVRIGVCVLSPAGLRWLFRFADDFKAITAAPAVWLPLALLLLLLEGLGVPLK